MSLSPETPIPKKTNNHSPRDKNSHSPHTHGSTHESGCTNEPPGSTDSASAANHQRKPSRSAVRRLYPSKTPVRIIQRHPMLQFPLEATNPEVSVTNPKLHSPATPSDDTMFPPAAYLQASLSLPPARFHLRSRDSPLPPRPRSPWLGIHIALAIEAWGLEGLGQALTLAEEPTAVSELRRYGHPLHREAARAGGLY